jgi:hypothetical protein
MGRVCRECGWNRSFAAEEIEQSLRALPFVFAIFVLQSLSLSDGLESCVFLGSL